MPPRKQSATVQLKVRMKEPLRAELAKEAKKRGHSLNAEIVDRLEHSDWRLGSRETKNLMEVLAMAVSTVEHHTGKTWTEDEETMAQAYLAIYGILGAFGPWSPDVLRMRMLEKKTRLPFDVARNFLRMIAGSEISDELLDAMTGVKPGRSTGTPPKKGQMP